MSENAKTDCEELLNFQLPFAEEMLANCGEFIPFGGKMSSDGELVAVAGDTGEERPLSQDVIDLLRAAFSAEAKTGAIIATAIVYDVRVTAPGAAIKSDAVAFALDHHSATPSRYSSRTGLRADECSSTLLLATSETA